MKIYNNNVDKINSEALNREKKNVENRRDSNKLNREDKVEISSEALDIKKMEKGVMDFEINVEKVSKIKNQLNNGEYKVSSEKIADRIIEEETFDTYV